MSFCISFVEWLLSSGHFIIPSSWDGTPNCPMDYPSRFLAKQVSLQLYKLPIIPHIAPKKDSLHILVSLPRRPLLFCLFVCLLPNFYSPSLPSFDMSSKKLCCLPLPELQCRSGEVRLCSFHHTSVCHWLHLTHYIEGT